MHMNQPLVLDFDGSLDELTGVQVLPLADWQEAIRFGCGKKTWRMLQQTIESKMPLEYGTVLMGSGDFHHLSHLLIGRLGGRQAFDVVVCDNHPDNMRFPFGIHCGSWVRHVAALPQVRAVHVVGITSGDAGWRHAWENYLWPLYAGKVRYWTLGVDTRWARVVGLGDRISSFASRQDLIAQLTAMLRTANFPTYLSIDKDVLDPSVVRTNWDQGCLSLEDIEQIIATLAGRLVGSDITGEISIHHYTTRWKRWLSAMDDQPTVNPADLLRWRQQQAEVNHRLLSAISAAGG
jgi:hypothetical protein